MQTTDAPSEAGDAPPAGDAPTAPAGPRFFRWIRTLDLVRREGWLGGVCGAVAARIGIDVVIVRGIVVVLAVLGAPVVLVYAAAWLLLPDATGGIHALRLRRGRVDGPILGIGLLVLASFLPLTQGFWWAGASYWGEPDVAGSVGRILWTAVVLAVAIVVLVWLARRGGFDGSPATPVSPAPSSPAAAVESATASRSAANGEAAAGVEASTGSTGSEVEVDAAVEAASATVAGPGAEAGAGTVLPPSAPIAPAPGASDAELAAWREQQQAWREHRSAWMDQQRGEERARRQAQQEADAAVRRAQAAERRRRAPGAGAAYIGAVFGLALVAAAGTAIPITLLHPDRAAGWVAGFGAATVVLGVGLAVAGALRRRARVLALLAALTLFVAAMTAPLARLTGDLPPGAGYGVDTSHSGSYTQTAGGVTEFRVWDQSDPTARISLDQRGGRVQVWLETAAKTVRIIATISGGSVRTTTTDPSGVTSFREVPATSTAGAVSSYDATVGPGSPDLTLHLTLRDATVDILRSPIAATAPAPTPSTAVPQGAQP